MKRIDTSTKFTDLFGSGKHGFRDGDRATSVLATQLNASWCNTIQEELANVIEAAGIALNDADFAQVLTAIRALNPHNMQYFTASGNFIVPAGITKVIAEVWGGGSGGQAGIGASGAAGGYAIKSCSVTPGQVISVTVGLGGAATIYPTTSGAGGSSSFGAFCTATGGGAVNGAGTSGGIGVGGDVNLKGQAGSDLLATILSASGGSSPRGGVGGTPVLGGSSPEAGPGNVPGGGGAAVYLTDNSGSAGTGAGGAVLISW